MLYDTYEIEELRCDSNKGLKLIPAFDVVVSRNKVVIDLGTLTDEYEPEISIHTTATDKVTGEKSIVAGKSVTIVDTVTLDGLVKGTKYQLKGWEMVKSENAELIVNGERVENDYTFTAKDSKMEVEIAFTFNASALGGKDLVTFEELYDMTNTRNTQSMTMSCPLRLTNTHRLRKSTAFVKWWRIYQKIYRTNFQSCSAISAAWKNCANTQTILSIIPIVTI